MNVEVVKERVTTPTWTLDGWITRWGRMWRDIAWEIYITTRHGGRWGWFK